MDNELWDAVAEKNEWTFTEFRLRRLVDEFLAINDLSELSSLLCKMLAIYTSEPYALYKTTIIAKYMCERHPEEFCALLTEKKSILESAKTSSYVDSYHMDKGANAQNNIEQLLDFIAIKKKSGNGVEAGIGCTTKKNLDSAANRLLQTLNSMEGIKSERTLQNLRSTIAQLNKYLSGTITPEKYTGLDETPHLDGVLYGKIVESIVDKFDDNWPMIEKNVDPIVERLIVVNRTTFHMFHESLMVLTDALKISKNARVTDTIVLLLEKIMKSEAPLSAIAEVCRADEETTMKREETESRWLNTLQVIVSLPNRIANKLGINVVESFLPENYAKIISVHIGRAILFLNACRTKLDIKHLDMKPLSMLISKAVIVFGSRRFENLFEIMSAWCRENSDDIREFINKIFSSIDRPAVQSIAVWFLKNSNQTAGVDNVFGDLLSNPNWKHVFVTKIPLMSCYNDENLIINLIGYLSTGSRIDERILPNLFIKLLDIWGDRSALNHTSLEQHEYITKLIIVSVREIRTVLQTNDKDTAKRLLFAGTSAHLESTQPEIRAIGMITGEIVVQMLNDFDEDAPKLKFDYDGMPEAAREIVENLRNIGVVDKKSEKSESTEENRRLTADSRVLDDTGERKLYELEIKCGIIVVDAAPETASEFLPNEKKISVETKIDTEQRSIDRAQSANDDDEELLDSDDDLVAYDMSNDTPISEKLRPTYLRDLKENLLNAQSSSDPNIFAESMKAAEDSILSQLPNDDASFGVELLDILVSLRENSYVENFAILKFNACVAIVVVCPKDAAKFLCNKFHTKISEYSISDRLFILDVLSESARKLSKIEIKSTVDGNERPAVNERKRPFAKRISLTMDSSNIKKYETLYDDDFEVSSTGKESESDWEEIVKMRIQTNTRRFAHPSKRPVTTINRFNDVATSFFYPLLYGFRKKGSCMYDTPKTFEDQENILLVHYLKALSRIMMAAENCVAVPKMAKEILDLAWSLRYHAQAKVRFSIIENIASVIVTLRKEHLTAHLMEFIYEFRAWLSDVSEDGIRGDPDTNCRNLAKNVVALVDSMFHSTLNDL